ncbi:MAG TPA: hypothetical protein DCQ32_05480, partial [Cyanobacteria bacterium UBA8156]|nr:hypothetical protein [Cyanobacteria bacterium UBA8156]
MCAQFHGTGTKTLEVNIPEQLTLTVSLRGSREVRDGYQLFRLTGQLDAFSEPSFRRVMVRCIDEGPAHLILDLSTIDFMDSSGLGVLVQIAKKIQVNQGSLRIVTNPRVTQTVKLVRLEQFLSLVTSLEEAQAGLLAPPPTMAPTPEPGSAPTPTLAPEPPDHQNTNHQNTNSQDPSLGVGERQAVATTLSGDGKGGEPVTELSTKIANEIQPEIPTVAPNTRPKRNRSKTSAKTKESPEPSVLETPPPLA